jgi:N-acetylmuramoyl-L-alanine amidase
MAASSGIGASMSPDGTVRGLKHTGTPPARQVMRHLGVTLVVAVILATLFTAWTPAGLSPGEFASQLAAAFDLRGGGGAAGVAAQETSAPRELRVGIVIGHSGINPTTESDDPGSVCQDTGLTELEVNRAIGIRAAQALEAAGLTVDVLEEFDAQLFEYHAVALVSIHADSCTPINEFATGFKVTSALDTVVPDRAQRLVDCIVDRYGRATGMEYHQGSITRDMTEYHTFKEVHSQTPAAIIETGFLYLDRDFLLANPEKAARGIAEGVLCYVNNEPANLPGESSQ